VLAEIIQKLLSDFPEIHCGSYGFGF